MKLRWSTHLREMFLLSIVGITVFVVVVLFPLDSSQQDASFAVGEDCILTGCCANGIWDLLEEGMDCGGICDTVCSVAGTGVSSLSGGVLVTGSVATIEVCVGGIDEDADTALDCLDSDCFGHIDCCSNGIQDGDETGIDCGGGCLIVCNSTSGSGVNTGGTLVLSGVGTTTGTNTVVNTGVYTQSGSLIGQDKNLDGIDDGLQPGRVYFSPSVSQPTIGVAFDITDSPACTLTAYSTTPQVAKEPWYTYPGGLVSFTVKDCAQLTMHLYFHGITHSAGLVFRKFTSQGWQYLSGQSIMFVAPGVLKVTYTIDDNGMYDTDPLIGSIQDPGALACLDIDANGICDSQQSSINTGTTAPSSSSSTWQTYPIGSIDIVANDSSLEREQLLYRTVDFSTTTYAPAFPESRQDLVISLPDQLDYQSRSYGVDSDMTFVQFSDQGDRLVFSFETSGIPSLQTTTQKTYEGTITFRTQATRDFDGVSSFRATAGLTCYALSSSAYSYTGNQTCSLSSSSTSAYTLASDAFRMTTVGTSSIASATTNTTISSTTTSSLAVARCGNGKIEANESCDDGNEFSSDGCSRCVIESGRRCATTEPSQCGTIDCFQHGQVFDSRNIFGQCCDGLERVSFPKNARLLSGSETMHICYDPAIDIPLCLVDRSPSGWRVLSSYEATGTTLLMQDSCDHRYKNYYQELLVFLQTYRQLCAFGDDAYDEVDFLDINRTKQKSAIEALQRYCVVKGVGEGYDRFMPSKRITRAELLKILMKLIYIVEGKTSVVQSESFVYSGEIYFLDVSNTFRGAQYIADAYTRGYLHVFTEGAFLPKFFWPQKSMTQEEIIALLRTVPYGQFLSEDAMKQVLGRGTYPNRGVVAELLVKKFLPSLVDYFYIQGDQEEYYRTLAEKLRGKTYAEQYKIIVNQIYTLEEQHFAFGGYTTLDEYRMRTFLQDLIQE